MIDFELGDELELVRETAREFAADHLRPGLREHEAARAPRASARGAFAEIGFATLEWPEALGGHFRRPRWSRTAGVPFPCSRRARRSGHRR